MPNLFKMIKNYFYDKRLSETGILEELDFNTPFRVSIEAPTGSGKSYYIIEFLKEHQIPFIYAADTLLLSQRLSARHNIPHYCAADRSHCESDSLITVYQHIPKFTGKGKVLVIDEAHSLITDYSWKKEVIEKVMTCGEGYDRIILLSGTSEYSGDPFYRDMAICKSHPQNPVQKKLYLTRYEDCVGGIVELVMNGREWGKKMVISLLDKSTLLPVLLEELKKEGFNSIAVINSVTRKEGEHDISITAGDGTEESTDYYQQILKSGRVDAEIIITTYRQGYDLLGDDYELIIAPSRNRHSYCDIIQMMNRFRDMEEVNSFLLTNANFEEVSYSDIYEQKQVMVQEMIKATEAEIERKKQMNKNYRALKYQLALNGSPCDRYIYCDYHVNYQSISYHIFCKLNIFIHNNLTGMKHVLSPYNIALDMHPHKLTRKSTTKPPKKETMKYTQEEVEKAVNEYIEFFLPTEEPNFNKIFAPDMTPLHHNIKEYYEDFKMCGIEEDVIVKLLKENLANSTRMKKIHEIYMIKYSPDATLKLYRSLLLQNFIVGERLTGQEIAGRINECREKVGLSRQAGKTNVAFFNKLFVTKREKMNDDSKKWGYMIVEKF